MTRFSLALATLLTWHGTVAAQLSPPESGEAATVAPDTRELRSDLTRILAAPGWKDDAYGVLVVSLDRGDTLFSLHADRPLTPASNTKLFSTAAALHYLGPDFRYSTYLLADGPVREGILEGDLILYGTGDPSISGRMLPGALSALEALADTLSARGVREVRGALVGDGSYFDDAWIGPGWQRNDLDATYGAPVGALSVAENVVSIRFRPGSVGGAAQISTLPATRGFALVNRVTTVSTGATSVAFTREDGKLVATGRIRRESGGIVRTLPVVDPANFAAAALRAVLEERGIQVHGGVGTVVSAALSRVSFSGGGAAATPPPEVVAVHHSPPLSEIVSVTNHVSHNMFAEALLKTVGRAVRGEGTFEAGADAVYAFLESDAIAAAPAITQIDGSGLSRNNLVTARTTIRLLDHMRRSDVWEWYFASLPSAAVPDGLERRMAGTEAAGNLRAKTGTIRQVSALSGYVTTRDGEQLAFSIFSNGVPSTARAKLMEDAIGARLASFSRSNDDAVSTIGSR